MASLKEIRERISSVSSTKKITSAMKMVSAAKLRKSEDRTQQFLPYKDKLTEVLNQYISSIDLEEEITIPLAEKRNVKRVILVCVSSSTGLCGIFNANVSNLLKSALEKYAYLGAENIEIYTVGKKIADFCRHREIPINDTYLRLCEKDPSYEDATVFAQELVDKFLDGETDHIEFLYNHHHNAAVQIPTQANFLPLNPETAEEVKAKKSNQLYFTEPDKATFINSLVPMVVRMNFYATLLDSLTAEHGARTTAMQMASENAGSLIETITQQYNRARQEAITNELLDIVGGSEAIKND